MSHFHRYYSLGPFDKSVCVIFRYLGPHSMTLHFLPTEDVPNGVFSSDNNSIFKAPAGHRFTVEICEAAVGPGKEGRFHVKFELHPPMQASKMGEPLTVETLAVAESLPPGECTGEGDCAGAGSIACPVGKEPSCVDGVLECEEDEPGKKCT